LRILASALAIAGGILLLLSGVTGSLGLFGTLLELLTEFLSPPYDQIAYYIMMVLSFFASLGGGSVLLGGFLLYLNHITTGKLLIRLGCGTGVLGFLVLVYPEAMKGSEALLAFLTELAGSTGLLGIALSVSAMWLAGKTLRPKLPSPPVVQRVVRPP